MSFKKIGVICCEMEGYYQTKLMTGVIEQAQKLNYDILAFTNFVKNEIFTDYEYAQKNIFKLINFDLLDGVIVFGDTLKITGLRDEILFRLKHECHCPVVVIDYTDGHPYTNIAVDDVSSFEEIVDHLIDVHHCKDIMFFSGPDTVATTQTRLKGYRNSLKKHHMEDREIVRVDGDFWYNSGKAIAKEIADKTVAKPDAIVFCGDYMAIGAILELQQNGFRIPEDIIIIGYDAVDEAIKCNPPLTSYSPPIKAAGENAMLQVDALIRGETSVPFVKAHGNLEYGKTCGCNEDFSYTKRLLYRNEQDFNYREFLDSNMMEVLSNVTDLRSLLERIQYNLYLVKGWNDFYVCLCNNWIHPELLKNDDDYPTEGYTDEMTLYIKAENQNGCTMQDRFDVKQMLPPAFEEHPEPKTYFFTPLHQGKKCFGYSVITYTDKCKVFDLGYMNWIKHICNALEYFRMQSKISNLAVRDILTGIYNRIGLEQNLGFLTLRIYEQNSMFFVLVADVDNLKKTNDNYGHASGDVLIRTIAQCVNSVTRDTELCARFGGDEFIIYGCDTTYPQDYDKQVIQNILQKVAQINRSGRYPYKISVSLGAVMRHIDNADEIDQLYREADEQMYAMKVLNHQCRDN